MVLWTLISHQPDGLGISLEGILQRLRMEKFLYRVVIIDNTPLWAPKRPAWRQAKTPDPRSLLGAAAEVGPELARAGTIL